MTAFNIIKSLTRRGNVVVGSGCYAAAIGSNDPNNIIKIGNSITDPWLDYYHLIIKVNQNNPHVPKVKYFMCDVQHNYYICIMERLESDEDSEVVELCKDYTTRMITREEFVNIAKLHSEAIPCADTLADILDKIHEHTEVFARQFSSEFDEDSRLLDMHAGNFMYRDGVVVVTDPWCENDMSDLVDVSEWVDRSLFKTTSASW
jgi:hypothetical protein